MTTPCRASVVSILLCSLFILGCMDDTFTGALQVYDTVDLIGEEDEKVSLAPGAYPAKLNLNENRSVFEFELTDASKGKKKLYVKIAPSIRIPEKSGSFSVAASENGPAYDISGTVSYDSSQTETVRNVELCTVQRSLTDCAGPPPAECRQVWRTYQGRQPVEYHFDQKIKRLTLQFIGPENRRKIAAFTGEAGQRSKVYTYRGPCLPEGM